MVRGFPIIDAPIMSFTIKIGNPLVMVGSPPNQRWRLTGTHPTFSVAESWMFILIQPGSGSVCHLPTTERWRFTGPQAALMPRGSRGFTLADPCVRRHGVGRGGIDCLDTPNPVADEPIRCPGACMEASASMPRVVR